MILRGYVVIWTDRGKEHCALMADHAAALNYAVRVHGTVHPLYSEV